MRRRKVPARRTGVAPRALFLVGFMGAGKSSVGRALGQHLGWSFLDLDERIGQREGRSVPQIFRESGERAFRQAEKAALKDLLDELPAGPGMVVALGGGAFVHGRNAALIQSSGFPSIFLDAPVEELWRRCLNQNSASDRAQTATRPLLGDEQQFRKLCKARREGYLKASLRIETSGKKVRAIAAEVAAALGLTSDRRLKN